MPISLDGKYMDSIYPTIVMIAKIDDTNATNIDLR